MIILHRLPKQSFFDCALFGICYSLSETAPHSKLVEFLLRMIYVDVVWMMKQFFSIYIWLWIFNIGCAIYAIKKQLHLQIVESPQSWYVLLLGGASLTIMGLCVWLVDQYLNIPNIIKRKLFHIPPLILFPLLDYTAPELFQVAITGAFYILFLLQILRYMRQSEYPTPTPCPLEKIDKPLVQLWDWMAKFIDKRDRHLWVTHLSLFAGMMVTYYSRNTNHALRNMSVVLPIGDAMAALVGYKYGRVRIGSKSLQGFIAFVLTNIVMFLMMQRFYGEQIISIWKVSIAIIVCGLVELLSKQIDNLLLPLVFLQVYNAV